MTFVSSVDIVNKPLVSVIIVNFNGKTHLEECLKSLMNITHPKFEVILVDNNSTDDSIQFVTDHYPSVIILKLDTNRGFAEPNNMGAKIAKSDFFLFLNNDTIVTSNFISEMVKIIETDDKIAICQSLLLKPDGSIDSSGDFIDELGIAYNSTTPVNHVREITSARGASMLVRKKVFEDLGGFDDKFFVSFEDVDFGWRSWIAGYKTVLIPKSIVYHSGGKTYEKFRSELAFHGFKNQLSMKITNFEFPLSLTRFTKFFILYGIRELKIWFDYTFKGKTKLTPTDYEQIIAAKPSLQVIFKSLLWVLTNPSYLITKYKKINSFRVNSTQHLIKMNLISSKNL